MKLTPYTTGAEGDGKHRAREGEREGRREREAKEEEKGRPRTLRQDRETGMMPVLAGPSLCLCLCQCRRKRARSSWVQ